MSLKLILWIGGVVLIAIFVFQNAATVEIRFLFWKVSMSRVLLLGGAVLGGFLAGFTAGWEFFTQRNTPPGRNRSEISG